MKAVLSILIWVFTGIMTVLVFFAILFLLIFFLPFDRKRKSLHAQGFWWADVIFALNPFWEIKINGLEHIKAHKTYVVIANHQSLADIVMIYKTHMQFKWVAKKDLFKIPIFGWCMSWIKYIKLTRDDYGSIRSAYEEAGRWLKKDVSVLFFPEGTRSTTDEIGVFKSGAFKLAIKEKKPILPIRIEGTRDIIPRDSWIFKSRASCRVTVLAEIDTAEFQPQDFSRLIDKVRERLSSVSSS